MCDVWLLCVLECVLGYVCVSVYGIVCVVVLCVLVVCVCWCLSFYCS